MRRSNREETRNIKVWLHGESVSRAAAARCNALARWCRYSYCGDPGTLRIGCRLGSL